MINVISPIFRTSRCSREMLDNGLRGRMGTIVACVLVVRVLFALNLNTSFAVSAFSLKERLKLGMSSRTRKYHREYASYSNPRGFSTQLRVKSDSYQPYRGEQPVDALQEIFVPHILPKTMDDERLWVPQTDSVSFRPLCLCASGGYYVNLLRVQGSGLLSRHRHPGPVHGFVVKGRWRYLEHDWEAREGSYVFEPPGEIHTLVVPEGVDEMITLFHVTGSLLYCDEDGNVKGADDVFTKLDLAKRHYEAVGLGEDFVQQFVR